LRHVDGAAMARSLTASRPHGWALTASRSHVGGHWQPVDQMGGHWQPASRPHGWAQGGGAETVRGGDNSVVEYAYGSGELDCAGHLCLYAILTGLALPSRIDTGLIGLTPVLVVATPSLSSRKFWYKGMGYVPSMQEHDGVRPIQEHDHASGRDSVHVQMFDYIFAAMQSYAFSA
jgi:hypothetical protein